MAVVGPAASHFAPFANDACTLVCTPDMITTAHIHPRELSSMQLMGFCEHQPNSDQAQAQVLVSHCLKLCPNKLSHASEINCNILRSYFKSHLGCDCAALFQPMIRRMTYRTKHVVRELSRELISTILVDSPFKEKIICELYQEIFTDNANIESEMSSKCRVQATESDEEHAKQDAKQEIWDKVCDFCHQSKEEDSTNIDFNLVEKNGENDNKRAIIQDAKQEIWDKLCHFCRQVKEADSTNIDFNPLKKNQENDKRHAKQDAEQETWDKICNFCLQIREEKSADVNSIPLEKNEETITIEDGRGNEELNEDWTNFMSDKNKEFEHWYVNYDL